MGEGNVFLVTPVLFGAFFGGAAALITFFASWYVYMRVGYPLRKRNISAAKDAAFAFFAAFLVMSVLVFSAMQLLGRPIFPAISSSAGHH